MTPRRTRPALFAVTLSAFALSLGACAVRSADRYDDRPYRNTDVVVESAVSERVYYRDPGDSVNVYYYEPQRPDVVVYRQVYRENDGRTYYIERDGGVDRRFYYDDNVARSHHPSRGHDFVRDRVVEEPRRAETVVVQSNYNPQRIHYHESQDTTNVYYFDLRNPEVVVNRRIEREKDGRTYYVEREGGADRRYYFDDDAARRNPGKGHGPDKDKKDKDHGPDKDHGDKDHGPDKDHR